MKLGGHCIGAAAGALRRALGLQRMMPQFVKILNYLQKIDFLNRFQKALT